MRCNCTAPHRIAALVMRNAKQANKNNLFVFTTTIILQFPHLDISLCTSRRNIAQQSSSSSDDVVCEQMEPGDVVGSVVVCLCVGGVVD